MNTGQNFNYNYNKNENINLKKYKGIIKPLLIIVGAFILLKILFNSFTFTVDERKQVIVRQFNEVVRIVIDESEYNEDLENAIKTHSQLKNADIQVGKGLFFKLPFVQNTESYSNMLLTYDTNAREVITKDKKKVVLDNYAQWRISNPALFAMSLMNERAAHTRIDDIIYSKLNEEIGKVDAEVVISDKEYVTEMLSRVTDTANKQLSLYGVDVVDIRIKKTDYPEENYSNIFNRMITERERAAKTYRSEGQEEAQKIRSNADKRATILEAQAYEKAEKLKGEGDAEAARIYAEAYNKDMEFYEFWRTLLVYKKALKEKTSIVIDPDSDFAKYLFSAEE